MLPDNAHEFKESKVQCEEQRIQRCMGPVMLGMPQVTLKAPMPTHSYAMGSSELNLVMLAGPLSWAPAGVCSMQGFNPWTNASPAKITSQNSGLKTLMKVSHVQVFQV